MNKTLFLIALVLVTLFLNACNQPGILYGKKTIEITGKNWLSDTMTIKPGMEVNFFSSISDLLLTTTFDHGELIVCDGGKIIAQGTVDNPIIFTIKDNSSFARLVFAADSSAESILEYCEFNNTFYIDVYCSTVTFRNCRRNGQPYP